MPKVPSSRTRVRAQKSNEERYSRADRVIERGNEMTSYRCSRCEEKNLRCFVDTATGRCAGCISVKAECSLFVSEEEWEQVQQEREQKELEVARLKAQRAQLDAQLSQQEVALLEVKSRERSFARRDLAVLSFQDRAKEKAEGSSAPGTDPSSTGPSLSGPSTDPGWLQADYSSYDPLSLDFFLSYENPILVSAGVSDGIHVPVTCSSSGFLQVPKCYGFRAILAT
ncbi:Chromo domain containing protein [Pyrenophora tritici-repentis]|nr:Chromo domain containing protein [Pyrenophora tritici-repentis]